MRNDYLKRITNFRDFALTTLSVPANMLDDNMIAAMLEYIDELFFTGFPVEDGKKLIAAVRHHYPACSRSGAINLHRVERAIRGWSRHSISRVRSPLPFTVMVAMVGCMLHDTMTIPAIALLVCFCAYLRPGELFGLCRSHLCQPFPAEGLHFWSICFRAASEGAPRKRASSTRPSFWMACWAQF